jgi:hypothetical protein
MHIDALREHSMRIWLKRALGRRPDYIGLVGAAAILLGMCVMVGIIYTNAGDRASMASNDISSRIHNLAAHKP